MSTSTTNTVNPTPITSTGTEKNYARQVNSELGKDAFLRLLTTQLSRYRDWETREGQFWNA